MYIKLFAKNEKEVVNLIQTVKFNCLDIGKEFFSYKCAMIIMNCEKKTNNVANKIVKSGKIQNAYRERKLYVLVYIGNGRHQTTRYERKNKKIVLPTNKKASQNITLRQKSSLSNKHQGSSHCYVFWAILKMDKGRRQTNGTKDKEANDKVQCVTSD